MLQLGGVESERPHQLCWDETDPTQCFEAGQKTAELVKQGFTFISSKPGEALLKPPPLGESVCVMRILSENGDDRLLWDRTKPAEVKEAYAKFKDLQKKGYTAYAIKSDGSKGHKLADFDPTSGELILASGERIRSRETVMVPNTMPG